MNYIMTYEALMGNKFYFSSPNDITKNNNSSGIYLNSMFSKNPIKIYSVYVKNAIPLKFLTHTHSSNHLNYIYQVNKALNLFKFDDYHITKLINDYPSFKGSLIRYLSLKENDDIISKIKEFKDTKLNIIRRLDDDDMQKFYTKYDGIYLDENHIFVFDRIYYNAKLINGMAVKFKLNDSDENNDIEFPEYVIDELIRYTDLSNRKLNERAKDWLIKYAPKPKEPITLYRGISIDLFPNYNDSIVSDSKKLSSLLYRRIGVKEIKDLKKGFEIEAKRGKESSWSYYPEIAKAFILGMGKDDVNLLVKSVIKPEDIIVDLTLLPKKVKDKLDFIYQNEVIVNVGKYKSIISEIYFSKKAKSKLNLI